MVKSVKSIIFLLVKLPCSSKLSALAVFHVLKPASLGITLRVDGLQERDHNAKEIRQRDSTIGGLALEGLNFDIHKMGLLKNDTHFVEVYPRYMMGIPKNIQK